MIPCIVHYSVIVIYLFIDDSIQYWYSIHCVIVILLILEVYCYYSDIDDIVDDYDITGEKAANGFSQ